MYKSPSVCWHCSDRRVSAWGNSTDCPHCTEIPYLEHMTLAYQSQMNVGNREFAERRLRGQVIGGYMSVNDAAEIRATAGIGQQMRLI